MSEFIRYNLSSARGRTKHAKENEMLELITLVTVVAIAYQVGCYMGHRAAEKVINDIRKGN